MIPVLSLYYSAEDEHQETGINTSVCGKLTCDERASKVYGQDHISNGLLKVVGYGILFSENTDGQFVSLLRENRTFQSYPGWFSYFAREESSRSAVSRILRYTAAAQTRAADSYPALGARLKALNVSSLLRSPDVDLHYPLSLEFVLEELVSEVSVFSFKYFREFER